MSKTNQQNEPTVTITQYEYQRLIKQDCRANAVVEYIRTTAANEPYLDKNVVGILLGRYTILTDEELKKRKEK